MTIMQLLIANSDLISMVVAAVALVALALGLVEISDLSGRIKKYEEAVVERRTNIISWCVHNCPHKIELVSEAGEAGGADDDSDGVPPVFRID